MSIYVYVCKYVSVRFINTCKHVSKRLTKCLLLIRFAAFAYRPEGEVRERLWEETIAEFEFAGARGILDSLK